MILGLREGLRVVLEEGLDSRHTRHARNGAALRAGLEGLGLDLVSPEGYRLNQITPVWIPEGIDDNLVRETLLRDHNIEVGRGLGQFAGKVWRIGLMGESSRSEYVLALLAALEHILPSVGYETPMGAGVTAANRALSEWVSE
jgi:alanine-glyoxylate transaminase/serine-glyoxylate transaminase/serine-pyruvate transaminase